MALNIAQCKGALLILWGLPIWATAVYWYHFCSYLQAKNVPEEFFQTIVTGYFTFFLAIFGPKLGQKKIF